MAETTYADPIAELAVRAAKAEAERIAQALRKLLGEELATFLRVSVDEVEYKDGEPAEPVVFLWYREHPYRVYHDAHAAGDPFVIERGVRGSVAVQTREQLAVALVSSEQGWNPATLAMQQAR